MSQYNVTFENATSSPGFACIFQRYTDFMEGIPLAWLTKGCPSYSQCSFSWSLQYGFSWAEIGTPRPGAIYEAREVVNAGLSSGNMVSFGRMPDYRLYNHRSGQPGVLQIMTDSSIPMNTASVGFTLSGDTVLAVRAMPNYVLNLKPNSNFFIAFGNFRQGQMLDLHSIANIYELHFPAGGGSLNVKLHANMTWSTQ